MKILWIDLLCFKTIILVYLMKRSNFDHIYYINIHKTFRPFVNLASKILNKPISNIDYVVESEIYINNNNLHDVIQNRISSILERWLESTYTQKQITSFISKTGFSKSKYSSHLKEKAYYFAFKPIQIYSLAEVIGEGHTNLFLFKKTPISQEIKKTIGGELVDFYSYSNYGVEKRKTHHFDSFINNNYYKGNFFSYISLLKNWLSTSLPSLFNFRNTKKESVNIGVELIQMHVRQDSISDIYWLKNSDIDLNKVIGLTTVDYDSKSLHELGKTGIKIFNVSGSIFKAINHRIQIHEIRRHTKFIFADIKYFINTFSRAFRIFTLIFSSNSSSWFSFQESYYFIRTEFWKSIYSQFNIRMLWTMYDVDQDKLTKAQALEIMDGLYLGSHWSNYPVPKIINAKCYDIYLVWSKYFISKNFASHCNNRAVFKVGFPSDHYFKSLQKESKLIKDKYSGSFIISYFDNQLGNDLPQSENMQFDIYTLLIELLSSHKNLIIFFKPKRQNEFNNYLLKFPSLIEFINIGRVRVFFGESQRDKTSPAKVALASDLVLGVGISSAAAEGCFAGSVSFHINLSQVNNDFDKYGLNKVVFRDLVNLKKAIIDQINGNGISVDVCQKYHKILDPFQDGLAYKRTGLILAKIQNELNKDDNLDNIIKKTKDKFSELHC